MTRERSGRGSPHASGRGSGGRSPPETNDTFLYVIAPTRRFPVETKGRCSTLSASGVAFGRARPVRDGGEAGSALAENRRRRGPIFACYPSVRCCSRRGCSLRGRDHPPCARRRAACRGAGCRHLWKPRERAATLRSLLTMARRLPVRSPWRAAALRLLRERYGVTAWPRRRSVARRARGRWPSSTVRPGAPLRGEGQGYGRPVFFCMPQGWTRTRWCPGS